MHYKCFCLEDPSTWTTTFEKIIAKCGAIVKEANPSANESDRDLTDKNPSSQLVESIASFLTCEFCQNIYDDPRVLPCNHTFCQKDLLSWAQTNDPEPFSCPKCRIESLVEIEELPVDMKAVQMVKAHKIMQEKMSSHPAKEVSVTPVRQTTTFTPRPAQIQTQVKFPEDLQQWFESYKIPKECQEILYDDGFDAINLVLELTIEDVDNLPLATGHKRRLFKSLKSSRGEGAEEPQQSPFRVRSTIVPRSSQVVQVQSAHAEYSIGEFELCSAQLVEVLEPELDLGDPEWLLLDNIYDERALSSGTHPADSLKFWASFAPNDREEFVTRIKSMGDSVVRQSANLEPAVKSEKLRKIAMVLCDAGEYEDSILFSTHAVESLTKHSEGYFVTSALLCLATMFKLKMPLYIKQGDELNDELSDWKNLVEKVDKIIKDMNEWAISQAMLMKLYIMKVFSIDAVKARDRFVKKTEKKQIFFSTSFLFFFHTGKLN